MRLRLVDVPGMRHSVRRRSATTLTNRPARLTQSVSGTPLPEPEECTVTECLHFAPGTCDADSACMWDPNTEECIAKVPDCASLTSPQACNAHYTDALRVGLRDWNLHGEALHPPLRYGVPGGPLMPLGRRL